MAGPQQVNPVPLKILIFIKNKNVKIVFYSLFFKIISGLLKRRRIGKKEVVAEKDKASPKTRRRRLSVVRRLLLKEKRNTGISVVKGHPAEKEDKFIGITSVLFLMYFVFF